MKIYQNRIPLALFFVLLVSSVFAQPSQNWDKEKIRGERYIIRGGYNGTQFFLPDWVDGKIIFTSGEELDGVKLRYNTYLNELITYNTTKNQMVKVDKATVVAFELTDLDKKHHFEKRYYNGFALKGDKYMELLYDGEVKLYCYRIIELQSVSPYLDKSGILKNMEFSVTDRYFLIGDNDEYYPIRLRKGSIFNYLSKSDKRLVKKMLRQNGIVLGSESELIRAIEVLDKNGIEFALL